MIVYSIVIKMSYNIFYKIKKIKRNNIITYYKNIL